MNHIRTITSTVAALAIIFLFCDGDDDEKVLKPALNSKNFQECNDVRCFIIDGDTVCYKGYKKERLPENHRCCQNLIEEEPSSTPSGGKPPDTLQESRMISIVISDSSKVYGLDDGKECYLYDKNCADKRNHYISIKENGSISFQLYISPTIKRLFNSFKVKVEDGNFLSFDSVYYCDTMIINDTLATITMYCKSSDSKPIDLLVYGNPRTGVPKELVCDTCDTKIGVLCYDEQVLDTMRIYFINNPSFNPDSVTLKNEINNIMKQAVQKVAFVFKGVYNQTGWDNNGNGKLDLFPKKDSVPPAMLENHNLQDSIESVFNDCASCQDPQISRQTPKVFVVPSGINANWLLMEDAAAGSDTIVVQYDEEFKYSLLNGKFVLRTWDGSVQDSFQITKVLKDNISQRRTYLRKYSTKLGNNYPRYSVLVLENYYGGFTMKTTSCSWLTGTTNHHNLIHEMYHMRKVGPLSHPVRDTINLLFYRYVNSSFTRLRYRQLFTDDCMKTGYYNKQWDIVRQIKY